MGYNLKIPSVKRLMREALELREPTYEYHAQPLEENLFEWHFTIRGPPDSDFEGGIYHGRILIPADYPCKPPNIIFLTPNGRFEVNKKICLSISGYHPESWLPSWSIRTALLAIIGFMPSLGRGALGSLDFPKEERHKLAVKSLSWSCSLCGPCHQLLRDQPDSSRNSEEAKVLGMQVKPSPSDSATTSIVANHVSQASSEGVDESTATSFSEETVPGKAVAGGLSTNAFSVIGLEGADPEPRAEDGHDLAGTSEPELRQRNAIYLPQPVMFENGHQNVSEQVRSGLIDKILWFFIIFIGIFYFRRVVEFFFRA
ncbi:ubiquitin-conjugating enzyme E2 J1-like isoform X2 [Artemia franciscana]|uniref:ubiquitin-conjugating enzyme E2 J1-like isoform X2 n=1 Tax=Artemia franciscana TaxID=6661 RepID=UPI0032D9EF4A